MTLVHCTGFEHGVPPFTSAGGGVAGISTTGDGSALLVESTIVAPGGSTRSMKIVNTGGQEKMWQSPIPSGASDGIQVGSVKFYIGSLPTQASYYWDFIFGGVWTTNEFFHVRVYGSGEIGTVWDGGTYVAAGNLTVTTGRWYLFEWLADLTGTTYTLTCMLDRVRFAATAERTGVSPDLMGVTQVHLKIVNAADSSQAVGTVYFDDLVWGMKHKVDYPIGPMTVRLLSPSGASVHDGITLSQWDTATDITSSPVNTPFTGLTEATSSSYLANIYGDTTGIRINAASPAGKARYRLSIPPDEFEQVACCWAIAGARIETGSGSTYALSLYDPLYAPVGPSYQEIVSDTAASAWRYVGAALPWLFDYSWVGENTSRSAQSVTAERLSLVSLCLSATDASPAIYVRGIGVEAAYCTPVPTALPVFKPSSTSLQFNGFESGYTSSMTPGVIDSITATATYSGGTAGRRSGDRGLRVTHTASSQSCALQHNVSGSPAQFAFVGYIRVPTLGSAVSDHLTVKVNVADTWARFGVTDDNYLTAYWLDSTTPRSRVTATEFGQIQAGAWYRIEASLDVSGATWTIDWRVALGDGPGVQQPTSSWNQGGSTNVTIFQYGSIATTPASGFIVDLDDIAWTTDPGYYPFGPVQIWPLAVRGCGVHTHAEPLVSPYSHVAHEDMTSWQLIADPPGAIGTDYVEVVASGSGYYLEYLFQDPAHPYVIGGVKPIIVQSNSTTGTVTVTSYLRAGGTSGTIASGDAGNNTTNRYACATFTAPPGRTGEPWTHHLLRDARIRWGHCADVSTVHPRLQKAFLEVLYLLDPKPPNGTPFVAKRIGL